jgi:quinol monooxygenase YgiN
MDKLALFALLEARPGKEAAVEEVLKSAQPLVLQEAGTTNWYACRMEPAAFAIFDTFVDKDGRNAHLNGELRKLYSQQPKSYSQLRRELKCSKFSHRKTS